MKTYNHLLVNGCSFSFGATLENIEQDNNNCKNSEKDDTQEITNW